MDNIVKPSTLFISLPQHSLKMVWIPLSKSLQIQICFSCRTLEVFPWWNTHSIIAMRFVSYCVNFYHAKKILQNRGWYNIHQYLMLRCKAKENDVTALQHSVQTLLHFVFTVVPLSQIATISWVEIGAASCAKIISIKLSCSIPSRN